MGLDNVVEFSTAKLLKEKNFNKVCSYFYIKPNSKMFGIDEHGSHYPIKNKSKSLLVTGNVAVLNDKNVYQAPTIAEVVTWIYELHNIWIYSKRSCEIINNEAFDKFSFVIEFIPQTQFDIDDSNNFNSPIEAYEAAIEYCLNNLLK